MIMFDTVFLQLDSCKDNIVNFNFQDILELGSIEAANLTIEETDELKVCRGNLINEAQISSINF